MTEPAKTEFELLEALRDAVRKEAEVVANRNVLRQDSIRADNALKAANNEVDDAQSGVDRARLMLRDFYNGANQDSNLEKEYAS